MPAPQTVEELLGLVAEFVGDDKDRARSVGKAILANDSTKPLADVLKKRGFNEGNAVATKAQARVTELEGQVALLNEQIEEKDSALQQLQSAQPDFARRLRDTEEKYQKRVRELEDTLVGEQQGRREDILANHRERFLSLLLPHLADEDYARYTALPKYQQYIDLDNDKKLIVKEPGEGVPYDGTKGDPLKQLVADALEEIPSKYRAIPAADAGAGSMPRPPGPQRPKTVEEIKEVRRKSGLYAM